MNSLSSSMASIYKSRAATPGNNPVAPLTAAQTIRHLMREDAEEVDPKRVEKARESGE